MEQKDKYTPEEEAEFKRAYDRLSICYRAFNCAFSNLIGSGLEDLSQREFALAMARFERSVPDNARIREDKGKSLDEMRRSIPEKYLKTILSL